MIITARNILVGFLNIILSVVAFFLSFRIIFEAFGANNATPFVSWIYRVSSNFMYPFKGIFPTIPLGNGTYFDTVALVTLLAYTLVMYLVIAVIDRVLLYIPKRTTNQAYHRPEREVHFNH